MSTIGIIALAGVAFLVGVAVTVIVLGHSVEPPPW